MIGSGQDPERDDPLGGAFGAARAVRAGDFVFTSSLGGVLRLRYDTPQHSETFEGQMRVVGERVSRCLARFDYSTADIVDATVWLHPTVEINAGELLDLLQAEVFRGCIPAMTVVRAPDVFDDALVRVKVVAYKPRRPDASERDIAGKGSEVILEAEPDLP
jgi:enamine deaminase RidA (YjgF/YER057c/UK114 family)